MKSHEIRQSFIDFFVERGHVHKPSGPLVPHGDPTLLFTNAGMVQFKSYFLGLEQPDSPRAVTSQKCLRVSGKHNDLENVGPSPRHHTFFEMLGNFSFGDYFKAEAIEFGWDLVTRVWGIPADRLFASVFEEDDEAFDLWGKISSLPDSRIVRCGKADNFWAMGDTGPCGPCSEIFIDLRPDESHVPFEEGSETGRYLEIWNLVFMQFERSADGELVPLPKPSIDTGSGLERVAASLQGVVSNYDSDLFVPILAAAAERAETSYGAAPDQDVSLRVIADHLRALGFLLADGVIPSNEGRGYVLRRILRRAQRHGMKIGLEEPFLCDLLPSLTAVLGEPYGQLVEAESASRETVRAEEEKFLATLASGARQVQEAIEKARARGENIIPGADVFRLYDTHGLPLESIQEIAEEEQMGLDRAGFEAHLEEQRSRSRAFASSSADQLGTVRGLLNGASELQSTEFVGYDRLSENQVTLAGLVKQVDGDFSRTTSLEEGDSGVMVLERTVFYSESGGQVADHGRVRSATGEARVVDVQRDPTGLVLHWLEDTSGRLEEGQQVDLEVDEDLRWQTQRHHTATHLLHAALREELGDGVRQAGSLVHPERLRFDFTYGSAVSAEQCRELEKRVSSWVRQADPVNISERSYDDAVAAGAMALFGEKYGDVVRTVDVPGVSLELCGGCHVNNTGQIGSFVITSEKGVASGVRRIEALAGGLADEWQRAQRKLLGDVEAALGVGADRLSEEIRSLRQQLKEKDRELSSLRTKMLSGGTASESDQPVELSGVKVLFREVPDAPANELRNLADVLRGQLGSGVVVLGAKGGEKISLIAAVTDDLKERVHAGQLARTMGAAVGGKGGGRPDFAQAGGKDPERLPEAFDAAREALREQLEAAS